MTSIGRPSDLKRIKILIVEDEALIALSFRRVLQLAGYSVCDPVATGERAIRAAAAEQPDVVLMDIRILGAMDGIEAARQIVAMRRTFIVFLTGYSDADLKARAQAVPDAVYLTKPVSPNSLLEVLARLLERGVAGQSPTR